MSHLDYLFDDDYFTFWRSVNQLEERSKKEVEWATQLLSHSRVSHDAVVSDPLTQYLGESLEHARRALREVEHEIYVRTKLHNQSIEQLDYQIGRAAVSLSRFSNWAIGYNRGVDQERIELERTLLDLRKEKRSWRIRAWDDLVRLRSELRVRRKEYESALRRSKAGPS